MVRIRHWHGHWDWHLSDQLSQVTILLLRINRKRKRERRLMEALPGTWWFFTCRLPSPGSIIEGSRLEAELARSL